MTRSVAIFDICGTLYRSNTTFDFLDFYWRERGATWHRHFVRALRSPPGKATHRILSWVMHKDIFRALAVRTLAGQAAVDVEVMARRFVREFLAERRHQEVFALMDSERKAGAKIVLMSSSIHPVVRAVATALDVDRYFCSHLAEVEGRLLGYFSSDIRGKKHDVFEKNYVYEDEFLFVTDNKEDLPLLKKSTCAYIVTSKRRQSFWGANKHKFFNIILVK